MTLDHEYARLRDQLQLALKEAPTAQRELLAATDAVYDFIEQAGEGLDNDRYLELKLMASQAESILTRYFGM